MTDRRREMARENVCVRGLLLSTNAGEEVGVVSREIDGALLLGEELVLLAVEFPADGVADDEHALGAIEGRAVLVILLNVGRPDALLVDELLLPVALVVL